MRGKFRLFPLLSPSLCTGFPARTIPFCFVPCSPILAITKTVLCFFIFILEKDREAVVAAVAVAARRRQRRRQRPCFPSSSSPFCLFLLCAPLRRSLLSYSAFEPSMEMVLSASSIKWLLFSSHNSNLKQNKGRNSRGKKKTLFNSLSLS